MNGALTFSKFRKPAAIAAASVLALAVSLPGAGLAPSAFADQQIGNTDVNITGLDKGDTVTAYTIATASVDGNNVLSYKFSEGLPENYNELSEWSKIASDGQSFPVSGTNSDAQKAAAAVAAEKSSLTPSTPATADENGSAKLNLAPGYYLIQVSSTSGTAKVYQNMLVNLTPKTVDNKYVAADSVTEAAKSSSVTVDKKAKGADGKYDQNEVSKKVGDTVDFQITSAIPSYPENATSATYEIHDDPTNMSIDGSSIKVAVNGTLVSASDSTYTLGKDNGKLSISFTKAYVLANQGANVTVTYTATITGTDSVNGTAANSATVEYNRNPYTDVTSTTDPSKVTDKTYGYVFQKAVGNADTKANDSDKKATFTLYQSNQKVVVGEGTNATSEFSTDANGYVTISGLAAGEYTLKETGVPAGYQAIDDITFTVGPNASTGDNPATGEVTETNFTNDAARPKVDAANGTLPSTGEAGTYMLIIAGIALAAGGTALVMRARKQED